MSIRSSVCPTTRRYTTTVSIPAHRHRNNESISRENNSRDIQPRVNVNNESTEIIRFANACANTVWWKTRLMTMATVNFGRWQTSCSTVIKGSTQNVVPWPIKQLRSEPDHYREFEIEGWDLYVSKMKKDGELYP